MKNVYLSRLFSTWTRPYNPHSFSVWISIAVVFMVNANAKAFETLEQLRASRDAYINHFRIHGTRDPEKASAIENNIKTFVEASDGELRARALFELAMIQRISNKFGEAIRNYESTAAVAEALGHKDLLFDAWLGIARSHAYGTRDHGATAVAFEQAVVSAGTEPTPKQRYEMAGYLSQMQAGRGELEAALLNAMEAIRLAQDDSDLFYAQLDTGDILQKFAESCDYRKLIDAKTYMEEDSWGACRRAVGTARHYYVQARQTAQKLGWHFLDKEAAGFISRLDMRLFLIEQKASFEKLGQASVFKAQDVRDVLVNEDFSAGASQLSECLPIGALIDEVAPDSQAADPRSIYLRGLKADLDGQPEKALECFQRAAELLRAERSSLFDPRRRGTVIENRPELVRDLALRFLAFRQLDDAFMAFESIRSHGLSGLASAHEQFGFKNAERKWLANLVQLESQASATQRVLVETVIAGIEHSRYAEMLENLSRIKQQRRELLRQPEFQQTAKRLDSAGYSSPTMSELQNVVRKAGIPVVLFWVTHTNVVVWVVSPKSVEVKTVFLPEVAVIDKVGKLIASAREEKRPFDEKSARELHTYLIKPFSKYLAQEQVLIIPQGPLVGLPFEMLIDAETGDFLVEHVTVSYAPNASFAIRALKNPLPVVSKVTAVYDENIEENTQEISRIGGIDALQMTSERSQNMTAQKVIELLGQAKNVHVLLHGEYDSEDPLRSSIKLNNASELQPDAEEITAAELLAVDWRDTNLAVFSSCEGAKAKIRISNELFGIPWALLAGGVDHVVLSRWRVEAASNADWMETFYETVASERASPALAAAAAMRKMIKSNQRDPYFWAGPQVLGR
ncbi:MAG: CHAT domain-containing protein [Anaerolineales bacterium]|nr:MAG: CHAT domain-containing protein [Anaerolineales bacterium]